MRLRIFFRAAAEYYQLSNSVNEQIFARTSNWPILEEWPNDILSTIFFLTFRYFITKYVCQFKFKGVLIDLITPLVFVDL